MSEYLKKQAVLEWLKEKQKKQEEKRDRLEIDHPYWEYHNGAYDYLSLAVEEFESGAFDADNTEIQRLRTALEDVHEELETLHFMIDQDDDIFHERKKKYLSIIEYVGQSVAWQALSTATVQAERVRNDGFLGEKINEKCPKCGADLLGNKVGDKWCSMAGCDYSINTPEGDGNDV